MQNTKKARLSVEATSISASDPHDKTLTAALEVQEILDKLADEMSEKGLKLILQLNEQYSSLRAPYYADRKLLLQEIPQFWKTVFLEHPVLRTLLTADDEDVLQYLAEMEIKEFEDQRGSFTLEFLFCSNPYFSNDMLVKTMKYDDAGCMVVDGTAPSWREGMEPLDVNEEVDSHTKRKNEKVYNFFMWFTESGTMESGQQDELSVLLRDDLWPNPLRYYKEKQKKSKEASHGYSDDHIKRPKRRSKPVEHLGESKAALDTEQPDT